MGWIWQLRHARLSESTRTRALDSLERNAWTQAQLINDLLDVSRISKGKLQLEMRLVDLKQVVEAVVESVAETVSRKTIAIDLDLQPTYVAGDEARLQQIVTNLLTNAMQFTAPRGQIWLTLVSEGDVAVLTVRDNGEGIAPMLLPHVFDQFRQGEGGLTRKHGGLGLGLAVVQQLIDLLGGSVAVTSQGLGHGATFTVRLPRESCPPINQGPGDRPLLLHEVNALIVGDTQADDMLKSVLESSGARVTIVSSTDGLREHATLVISRGVAAGTLIVEVPGTNGQCVSAALPASARPGQIVRAIGRLLAGGTKVS